MNATNYIGCKVPWSYDSTFGSYTAKFQFGTSTFVVTLSKDAYNWKPQFSVNGVVFWLAEHILHAPRHNRHLADLKQHIVEWMLSPSALEHLRESLYEAVAEYDGKIAELAKQADKAEKCSTMLSRIASDL